MSCGRCGGCGKSKSILKGVEYPLPNHMTITDFFRQRLLVDSIIHSDSPAILSGDGTSVAFTYGQLDSLSTKVAKALSLTELGNTSYRQSLGFWTSNSSDGDLTMAFSLPISEIIPIVILAILKLGAAFLAIPITFAEQHIIKLVGVTRPMVIIIEDSKPTIARYECVSGLLTVFHIEEIMTLAITGGYDDINEVFPLETLLRPSKRMASIVYTAGTMDQQLAVRLGHLEILNRCLWQYKTFPYGENEVASVTSCMEDVDSIAEILAPLLAGVQLHLIPRYILANPTSLIWRISEAKISRITLAPPALVALLSAYEEMTESDQALAPLASLMYWMVSGDTLPLAVAKKFFKLITFEDCDGDVCSQRPHPHKLSSRSQSTLRVSGKTISTAPSSGPSHTILIHFYGSTEVMSDVSYETFENCWHVHTKFKEGKVSIGKPIGNTIIYVVDEDMHIVEEGTIGEICVAGACVASGGYVFGTENDDTERFLPNPFTKRKAYSTIYQTEDFGRVVKDKNGTRNLFFEGRTEMIAKVKGKRLDLRDITKSVYDTKLVEQCSVFCYKPGMEDQAIVACCKLLPTSTQVKLEEALRESITDPDLVPQVFLVETFHYLPSGRLDKHRMFKLYKYHTVDATPEEWEPVVAYLPSPIQKGAAKILFAAIAMYTGNTVRTILSHYLSPMWSVGVNSVNALSIFLKVRENGYILDLTDFLKSESIVSIVFQMRAKVKGDGPIRRSQVADLIFTLSNTYEIKAVEESVKEGVITMLSKTYARRSYLAYYLSATWEDFSSLLYTNWNQIMKDKLSVFAYSVTHPETVMGACIVLDAYNEFKYPPHCPQKIKYMKELFHYGEKGPKEHLIWKKKGKAVEAIMIGTSLAASPLDSILLIMGLIEAAKAKAKSLGYNGAIFSGTNPLLKNLCDGILHDMAFEEVPINKFRAKDKTMPFRLAAPHHKLQVFYDSF